ncbi:hypothetical protein Tco_1378793 [Tanacetum coccineum]
MNMDKATQVSCIIDKLPPSWKDFKHTLKHKKDELTLVELGSHLRIEESLRMQDSDKPKGNNVAGPSVVNMYGKPGHLKKDCKGGKVGNKANGSGINGSVDGSTNSLKELACPPLHFKSMEGMLKDGLIPCFDIDTEKCKTCMLNKITKKPFQNVKRKTEVLEPIHSDLCDLHATPSLGNKIYFVTFIDDALRAVVRLLDPKLKTLGERGIECIFIGYAEHSKAFRFFVIKPNDSVAINSIIESRDAIFNENRFSSVPRPSLRIPNGTEDIGGSVVPKEVTKEVVQQLEPELRKSKMNRNPKNFGPEFQLYLIEGTRDEMLLLERAPIDEMDSIMGNNTWVLTDLHPVLRNSSYFDCTQYVTPMDTSEKLMLNNSQAVSQLNFTSNPEGYTAVSWISNTKDNSSTSGWEAGMVEKTCSLRFYYGLKSYSTNFYSTVTYNQMYNGKSRHLGVRHNMIRELITNRVISIEFVRSQQNLAGHLTKGLARDLVIKSAEGMGLKSN